MNGKLFELRYLFNILFKRYKKSNSVVEEVITKIDAAEVLLKQLMDLLTDIAIDLE